MTDRIGKLAAIVMIGVVALAISADTPVAQVTGASPGDPEVTPEMAKAASELLAARRANARRQRAGEPAVWMR